MIGGGIPIDSAGTILGAVGVSGSPTGEENDACAKAGIKSIAEALMFD